MIAQMVAPPPAVITAVRERVERLMLDLAPAQQDAATALANYEAKAARVTGMKKELDELSDFLQKEGEEVQPPVDSPVARSANIQLLARVRTILSDGRHWPTRNLYEELLRQGQVFTAANPVQRLSQVLSASGLFESDRARGWVLPKNEDPAATGSPGTTMSPTDEQGKEGA